MPMYMTRTFHPVGQGGFFTEKFSDKDSGKEFTVAYDVGSTTGKMKYLQKAIDSVGKVDVVFLSHLHEDHINGIPLLLKKNKNLKIIMPVLLIEEQLETAFYNMTNSNGSFEVYNDVSFASEFGIVNRDTIVTIGKSDNTPFRQEIQLKDVSGNNVHQKLVYDKWLYIPYNPCCVKSKDLAKVIIESNDEEIRHILQLNENDEYEIDSEALRRVFQNNPQKIKEIYKKICGDHNAYSMSLYSGPIDNSGNSSKSTGLISSCCGKSKPCFDSLKMSSWNVEHGLYTGDAELCDNMSCDQLIKYYKDYWHSIGILQVPHHGSAKNFNSKLCDKPPLNRLFIISVGSNNSYGHPSVSVINEIYEKSGCLSIITESSVPLAFNYIAY